MLLGLTSTPLYAEEEGAKGMLPSSSTQLLRLTSIDERDDGTIGVFIINTHTNRDQPHQFNTQLLTCLAPNIDEMQNLERECPKSSHPTMSVGKSL
jgi:hypothetical protein